MEATGLCTVATSGLPSGGATATFPEVSHHCFSFVYAVSHREHTGVAGDWTDNGACSSFAHVAGAYVTPHYESKSVPLEVPVKTPAALAPQHKNSRFFQ